MKIYKGDITNKLAMLKKAIPPKADAECLRGVLVKDCMMTATNLAITIQTPIESEPEERFIIPVKGIEIIENLPDGMVEIQPVKEGQLLICSGKIKNKISTFDPDDYPEIAQISAEGKASIESEELRDAISTILYAVAQVAANPVATGMLFQGDGESLNLVAMDGYRVAWAKIPYPDKLNMVIPKATVQVLLGVGLGDRIQISFNDKMALFELGEYAVYSRLLEGSYPDYQRFFPDYKSSLLVGRKEIVDSVQRASICLAEKTRPLITLDIKEGDGELTLSAKTGTDDYSEVLGLEAPAEQSLKIGFNGRYIQECLKSYDSELIELWFGTSNQPVVIDDGVIKSLVLPVRM